MSNIEGKNKQEHL